MVDKEMLTAMSEMMDQKFDEKLKPIHDRLDRLETDMKYVREEQLGNNVLPRLDGLEMDMKYVRVVQLENDVIPRLNTIEEYYVDTSKRYMERTEQVDTMREDIEVIQSVLMDHSQRLGKIPV
ncbi:MAG: hypothetical protein K2M70_12205 [Lachnospiraceae bacterium]|nr:hypothetical protein [Lachnospiraceae bacterium]